MAHCNVSADTVSLISEAGSFALLTRLVSGQCIYYID